MTGAKVVRAALVMVLMAGFAVYAIGRDIAINAALAGFACGAWLSVVVDRYERWRSAR